jgi:hypothetical protein
MEHPPLVHFIMISVICNYCGWIHFSYTRKEAQAEVDSFNIYYNTLPRQKQEDYYGGKCSHIRKYESCGGCGASYTNFRLLQPGEGPTGCFTISPIIHFSEPKPSTAFVLDADDSPIVEWRSSEKAEFEKEVLALHELFREMTKNRKPRFRK